ncbi:MAG: ribosome maturation factor RimP, partial [Caulobacteraceae bacterium]|nr:ribosome maturation factor RimP [Caulobacteraceae bacterium]
MRGKTSDDLRLLDLLDPVAEASGYAIVRLRLMAGDRARKLQIMAERSDRTMMIEDCARLARALSAVLDAADPVSGEYLLEVSSPGVDRPLTRLQDFAAYDGFEARLETDRLAGGRKRFKGRLVGVDANRVALAPADGTETVLIPFAWLVDARLVVNEALL